VVKDQPAYVYNYIHTALFLGRSLKSIPQVSRLKLTTQYFLAMKTAGVETQQLSGILAIGTSQRSNTTLHTQTEKYNIKNIIIINK